MRIQSPPLERGTVWSEDFRRIGGYGTTTDRDERPAALGFDARNPRSDALVRFRFRRAPAAARTSAVPSR